MVGLAEVQRRQRHRPAALQPRRRLRGGAFLQHLAAPAEPQAAGRRQRVAQRHREAAGGGLARVGDAVGDDDEPGHPQALPPQRKAVMG